MSIHDAHHPILPGESLEETRVQILASAPPIPRHRGHGDRRSHRRRRSVVPGSHRRRVNPAHPDARGRSSSTPASFAAELVRRGSALAET